MFTPEEITPTTASLEQFHHMHDHRSAFAERRQQILKQKYNEKQTDSLPSLSPDTADDLPSQSVLSTTSADIPVPTLSTASSPIANVAWRQVLQLREENRRLRAEVATLRPQTLNFQQAVEEAAQKHVRDITQGVITHPQETAPWLRQMLQEAQSHAQQTGDRHWNETLFLKRELQRIVVQFEREREQLNTQREQLAALQASVREHAIQREQTLDARLRARWRVVSIATSLGLLGLLVILQFACLALFRVGVVGMMNLALVVPIVICSLLALVLSTPLAFFKQVYMSAPHRIK
ncbi:hypothetical protein ccbrp13_66450 [Ktedonobacteria bacterium brp13]|nr:hypothetical protein ccbrp13_66450 [Ktedonobacteria bacterium brp13]